MTPARVAHESASIANVGGEFVGRDHETLEEQHGGAVADQTIALHLAETKATVAGTAFRWLTSPDAARSFSAGVHFVQDHVLV